MATSSGELAGVQAARINFPSRAELTTGMGGSGGDGLKYYQLYLPTGIYPGLSPGQSTTVYKYGIRITYFVMMNCYSYSLCTNYIN